MNENQHTALRPLFTSKWLLPALDAALVFAAFVLAYVLRYDLQLIRPVLEVSRVEFAPYLPYALLYMLLLYLHYQGSGLYKTVRGRSWVEEVVMITNGVTSAIVVLLALFFLLQPLATSRLMLVYVAGLTVVLLSLSRVVRRVVLAYLREKGIGVQRVLIVGMGDVGLALLRTMMARPELGYKPVGYLDSDSHEGYGDLGRIRGLGRPDQLEQVLREQGADTVIITLRWAEHDNIFRLVQACRRAGVEVRIVPDVFQLNLRQVQVENLDGIPLLGLNGSRSFRGASRLMKRLMDIGLIALASPVLLLTLLLVALAVRLEGPGPILYRQRRVGENGREFDMIKFRSMVPDAERYREELVKASGQDPRHPKLKDDPRITRVGSFIRRLSIDELPNVFNVLQGQMSIVGPRPPTPDEVALYEPWHMQRLKIIPGITGLWQVSGRSDVPFEEMCLLDIYYIENWSIKLDVQIILRTIPRVLLRSGAY